MQWASDKVRESVLLELFLAEKESLVDDRKDELTRFSRGCISEGMLYLLYRYKVEHSSTLLGGHYVDCSQRASVLSFILYGLLI